MSLEKVILELEKEEAMILFEFLTELDESDAIVRKSDQQVVSNIICLLEKNTDFLLNNSQYKEELQEARKKIEKHMIE